MVLNQYLIQTSIQVDQGKGMAESTTGQSKGNVCIVYVHGLHNYVQTTVVAALTVNCLNVSGSLRAAMEACTCQNRQQEYFSSVHAIYTSVLWSPWCAGPVLVAMCGCLLDCFS